MTKEEQELGTGVALRRLAFYLARLHIQIGIERQGPMSVILEAVAFGSSWGQRQYRIESIQRLNRRLFIYTEHRRMLRWLQVQPDNICGFAFEVRVVTRQIPF